MEERHKSLLRTERLFLTEHLQPLMENVVDRLLMTGVLNENMQQEIEAEPTKVGKARKLLDILPRRGPHAFNSFCTVLHEMNESEILKHLDPELSATRSPGAGTGSQAQPMPERNPTAYKPTTAREEANKPPSKGGPVPAQVPKPVQIPVPTPTKAIQPSSEPKPEPKKAEPKIDRQFSREIQKTEQPSEEVDNDLIDWPEKIDSSPSGIRKVKIQDCTHADLKKILSDTQVYDLSSPVKGRAVIVKNINYEDNTKLMKRVNADTDAYRLQDVFKRLRFNVKLYVDQTKEKLIQNLKKEQEEDQHDAFILVILSYGGVGTIMCTDGNEVSLRDILNVFTAENCPKLKNKPKLFFIQACGTRFNGGAAQGVSQPDEQKQGEPGVKDATDAMKSLALGAGDATGDIIQGSQDMLVAIATEPDVTEDSKQYLSLFILAVWTVLYKFSRNHHVLELLDKVNSIKKKSSGQAVKLCDVKHSLTNKFYFLPGHMGEHHTAVESLPSLPAPPLG